MKTFSFDTAGAFSFQPPSFGAADNSSGGSTGFTWSSWSDKQDTSFASVGKKDGEEDKKDGSDSATSGFSFSWNSSYQPATQTSAVGEEGGDDDTDNPAAFTAETKRPQVVLSDEPVKTGEEDEVTMANYRVKLFQLLAPGAAANGDEATESSSSAAEKKHKDTENGSAQKEWRERGVGTLKLNKLSDGRVRAVMRTETTFRLVLNSLLFKEMIYKKLNEKTVMINLFDEEAKAQSYMIKTNRADITADLLSQLDKIKNE